MEKAKKYIEEALNSLNIRRESMKLQDMLLNRHEFAFEGQNMK